MEVIVIDGVKYNAEPFTRLEVGGQYRNKLGALVTIKNEQCWFDYPFEDNYANRYMADGKYVSNNYNAANDLIQKVTRIVVETSKLPSSIQRFIAYAKQQGLTEVELEYTILESGIANFNNPVTARLLKFYFAGFRFASGDRSTRFVVGKATSSDTFEFSAKPKTHGTFSAALKESGRLAETNPDTKYVVFRTLRGHVKHLPV